MVNIVCLDGFFSAASKAAGLRVRVLFAAGHLGLPERGDAEPQLTNMAVCKMQSSFEGVKSIFFFIEYVTKEPESDNFFPEASRFVFFFF